MFGKKKNDKSEEIRKIDQNYTTWEQDLGFLNLLMSRRKNIIKNYFIGIFKSQLVKDTDFIRDEDLEETISSSIFEVYNQISPMYKQYLTEKYFGSNDELLRFITEDFYVELTAAAINQNNEKVRLSTLKKKVDNLQQFRKTDTDKENE